MGVTQQASLAQIIVATIVMLYALHISLGIRKKLSGPGREMWRAVILMMFFFLTSYLVSASMLVMEIPVTYNLVTGIIFLVGSVFVLLVMSIIRDSLKELNKKTSALKEANRELEEEISSRIHAENDLRTLSFTDSLTELYNRRGLMQFAEQAYKLATRQGKSVSLLYIDLNDLKTINDRFGHAAGDDALRNLGGLLRTTCRESDIVGRIGGDEFAVFSYGSPGDSDELARRLHENIAAFNSIGKKDYTLSISIGISKSPPQRKISLNEMMHIADKAMYNNKRQLAS